MKNIKIYNTDADYQIASALLPKIHVAYSKNNGSLHFGGVKKVVDYITEEEYGTAVFDVFRAQGWIASDANVMAMHEAKAITSIGTVFNSNTGIEDATFLKYFVNMTQFPAKVGFSYGGFIGCTNLKKVSIPNVTLAASNAFTNCPLEYVEFEEGVTVIPTNFINAGNTTVGTTFKLPSTLTEIGTNNLQRNGMEVLDLRNTSLVTIGNSFCYYNQNLRELYFPDTLTSIGENSFKQLPNSCYIEFNSNSSLSISNQFGRESNANVSLVVNFKNDISITIGNYVFATVGAAAKPSYVIFHSTTPPTIGTGFFNNSKASTQIFVPEGCVSDYEAVANLSSFVGRIYEIGGEEWTAAGLSQYE